MNVVYENRHLQAIDFIPTRIPSVKKPGTTQEIVPRFGVTAYEVIGKVDNPKENQIQLIVGLILSKDGKFRVYVQEDKIWYKRLDKNFTSIKEAVDSLASYLVFFQEK